MYSDDSARQVRVQGRDDIGEVPDDGRLAGGVRNIPKLEIYFPVTGEIAYYDARMVEDANPPQ